MCWIKFYVFVCLVHIRGDNVGVYPFGITYNQNVNQVTFVEPIPNSKTN
jgi:hypothetical protein